MTVRRIVIAGAAALAACGIAGGVPSAALAGSSSTATWARLAPATHPSGRLDAAMAYDAATGTVVLFSGGGRKLRTDTWTWG